ncbi:helix-turn-helix domain-containing protein [Rhodococcus hoagii]|nr:helix-turn-helix domain-containing protein [Prescottella equi]
MVVVVTQGRFRRTDGAQVEEKVPARGEEADASWLAPNTVSGKGVRDNARGNSSPATGLATADSLVPDVVGEPQRLWREVVGEQIRQVRTEHAERLADVATRAGVSPQYLSEIERGVKDPSSEVLAAVAGALGTSVEGLARRAYCLAPILQLSAVTSFAGGHQTAAGPVLLAA